MDTMLPLFSIITPTFNSEKYITQSIQSVLKQTYKNYEYIIVDGGSIDKTNFIIKSFSNYIDYSISEKDSGMYDALNKGFKKAKGDIFCYINSDDILLPNTLAIVAELFMINKNCDLIYGDMNIIDQNGLYLYTHCYRKIFRKEFNCYTQALIGQPSAFWKSKVFRKLNYFDTSFKLASDYDLFAKLIIDEKINYKYYPLSLSSLRVHQDTLSSRFKQINLLEVSKIRRRYQSSFVTIFVSKIITFFYKFFSIFRYGFSRLFYITRLKRISPNFKIKFSNLIYLRFLSFFNYINISKTVKIFARKNSNINICKGVKIKGNVNIFLNENSSLYIGENTIIHEKTNIYVNSSIFIGRNSIIEKGCNLGDSNIYNGNKLNYKNFDQIYFRSNSIIKSNSNIIYQSKKRISKK